MGWVRDISKTFQEFFKTTGGFVFKKITSTTAASSGYVKLYFKGDKLFFKNENNVEQQAYHKEDIEIIAELENSLAEICWHYYSEPKYLSNFATDDFDDETGINSLLSNYVYDAGNDWIEPPLSGTPYTVDVSVLADIERWDAKGNIATWQSTEPDDTKGYFAPSGEEGVWPNVGAGCTILYSGGSAGILAFTGGGNQTDEVELDTGVSDETAITAVYGTTVSSGNLTSNSVSGEGSELYQVDGIDPDNSNWITANSSIRIRVDKDDISGSSSRIQVKIAAPYYSGQTAYIERASIGPADGEGPSCTATPTEITDFAGIELSGSDNFVFTTSSAFDYDFTSATHHIVTLDWDTSDGSICESWSGSHNGTWWLKASSNTYDQAVVSGFSEQPGNYILADVTIIGEGDATPATEAHVATSSSLMQVDTSSWSGIYQITGEQSTPGTSTLYHMVSMNRNSENEVWRMYTTDWRTSARLNSGTWQYQDANDSYQNASVNTRLHAISQAMALSANQMNISVMQTIPPTKWEEIFSPGSLDFAWQLNSNSGEIVTFDKYQIYKDSNPNLEFITEDFEAKDNDPSYGFIVIKIKPIDTITLDTHLLGYISIDSGTNWEVVDLTTYKTEGDYTYARGVVYNMTPRSDKTIRAKVITTALKSVKVVSIAIGVR